MHCIGAGQPRTTAKRVTVTTDPFGGASTL